MRNDYVVYIHKNILNGKVYVGQTCNLSERWRNNGKNYFNSIKFYSQYHDYVELFKSWFGDNVDQKIIESAIIFWFKDVDCKSRNKVVSYFKEY